MVGPVSPYASAGVLNVVYDDRRQVCLHKQALIEEWRCLQSKLADRLARLSSGFATHTRVVHTACMPLLPASSLSIDSSGVSSSIWALSSR